MDFYFSNDCKLKKLFGKILNYVANCLTLLKQTKKIIKTN